VQKGEPAPGNRPYRPRPARLIISAVIVLWTAILGGCTRVHKAATGYEQYAGAAVKLPVSAAFGPDRRLWRVVSTEDRVYVDYSKDYGKSFSPPVAVNAERAPMWGQSEYRSQIVVDPAGRIYVAYPAFGLQPWTTYLSVSEDRGQHFSTPEPLSDQARVANSFQTVLALDAKNRLHAFWHDERGVANEASGNAIFHSVRDAGGKFIESNRKVVDGICSCCRLAADFDADGQPVLLFRNVYPGNIRDHELLKARSDGSGWTGARVSVDDWQIEACPVHGPALAIGPNGRYHIAWFTQGRVRQGLFYANSSDHWQHFSNPMPLGDMKKLPSHPDVIALGQRVILTWEEFDGVKTQIMAMQSQDGGRTWSQAKPAAESASESDYPFLLTNGQAIFVSWNSQREGYRLIPID